MARARRGGSGDVPRVGTRVVSQRSEGSPSVSRYELRLPPEIATDGNKTGVG